MLLVCHQNKTFVNIAIIIIHILLSDLKVTEVATYFSNRHIASLSLVWLNILA